MRRRIGQLLRYGCTAGAAAVVDLGGFAALVGLGVAIVPAAVASFLLATVVNYLLTARYVFGHPVSLRGYAGFLAAAGVGFALNVGVTAGAHGGLALSPLAAKASGIAIAFFANFALNAMVVFRDRT